MVVFATGFDAQDFCAGVNIIGPHGESLDAVWHGEPSALYGVSVGDFPNYFMTYGPQVGAVAHDVQSEVFAA